MLLAQRNPPSAVDGSWPITAFRLIRPTKIALASRRLRYGTIWPCSSQAPTTSTGKQLRNSPIQPGQERPRIWIKPISAATCPISMPATRIITAIAMQPKPMSSQREYPPVKPPRNATPLTAKVTRAMGMLRASGLNFRWFKWALPLIKDFRGSDKTERRDPP